MKRKLKKHKRKLYDTSAIAKRIAEQFGESAIYSSERRHVPTIPSGCLYLDWILDIGGYPHGRIVEIFGAESTGKTTILLYALKSIQRKGGVGVYVDAENSWDPVYAKSIGINADKLIVLQPETGEEAFDIAATSVDELRDVPSIVGLDSAVACIPKKQLEEGFDDASIGSQARLVSKGIVRMKEILRNSKCCFIITNQVREKIGVMWGDPETTPCGRALRHYATIRLQLKHRRFLAKNKVRFGFRLGIRTVKNKIGIPFKFGEVDMVFGEGIDIQKSIAECGVEVGVVKKGGGWLTFEDERFRGDGPYGSSLRQIAKLVRSQMRKER